MAIRAIGAFIFVALLGLFIAQPVLNSNDGGPDPRPRAEDSIEPAESPSEPSEPSKRKTTRRLANGYPRACLRPASSPDGAGLVAALDDGRVTIVTATGEVLAEIQDPASTVRPPIAWSPSGRVLAVGRQGLFWTAEGAPVSIGDVQHGMVVGAQGRWGWSPIADCGVHIDEAGELLVTAVDPNTTTPGGVAVGAGIPLVHREVESFAFAPDGRSLGLVMIDGERRAIWVADLVRNRMAEVRRFPSATCCVTLGGWSPDGESLLFWAASGASVSADGWPLKSVDSGNGRVSSITSMRVRPEFLERCGEDLVAILGGDRFNVGPMRIAELRVRGEPRLLTPLTESHFHLSCTRNGALIATARGPVLDGTEPAGTLPPTELAILRRDGSQVITLTPEGASEVAPEWGPSGTGLVFVRMVDGDSTVWFAAEGRTSVSLGVPVNIPRPGHAWHRVLDWSATPPTGRASS